MENLREYMNNTSKAAKDKIFNNLRLRYLYRGLKAFFLGVPKPKPYILDHVPELKHIVKARPSQTKELRINLLLPTINKTEVYGGASTALRFLKEISCYYKNVRIITYDSTPNTQTLKEYFEYKLVTLESDTNEPRQIVSLVNHEGNTLAIGPEDHFIATIWYTAYLTQRLVLWQSQAFNQPIKPFIYFIQDYEPGFYPWSSQYILARSTYEYKESVIAIYNTKLLQEYFHQQNHKFQYEYSFEPVMSKALQEGLTQFKYHKKNKQILIYGRPSTPRNAFTLILEGLKIWQNTFPDASSWQLISAGESHSDIALNDNLVIRSLGKLSLEEYARTLGESAIGLSFMVSPHPSYPPLEMAHYGMFVITNQYDNKDISLWHQNIISLSDSSPESIAHHLILLCQKIENDPVSGWLGKSYFYNYLDDVSPFCFIKNIYQKLQ